MKRRTKRTKRGGGGGSLSKISSEETLSKLRLKLNQNKAKSTKHAGRPADLSWSRANYCNQWCHIANFGSKIQKAKITTRAYLTPFANWIKLIDRLCRQTFAKLQYTHLQSDVVTLTSAINACDKGKAWQLALHSFFRWKDLIFPNAITCTTLMGALNTNAEWQQCLSLFQFYLAAPWLSLRFKGRLFWLVFTIRLRTVITVGRRGRRWRVFVGSLWHHTVLLGHSWSRDWGTIADRRNPFQRSDKRLRGW